MAAIDGLQKFYIGIGEFFKGKIWCFDGTGDDGLWGGYNERGKIFEWSLGNGETSIREKEESDLEKKNQQINSKRKQVNKNKVT